MNDADKFALKRRPSGALEKVKAGTNRILTDIAADTLAVMKAGASPNRVISVAVCGWADAGFQEMLKAMLRHGLSPYAELESHFFPWTTDFIAAARHARFDFVILLLNPGIYSRKEHAGCPPGQDPNWSDCGGEVNAYELIADLKMEFGTPVSVISNAIIYRSSATLKQAGADAVLGMPFSMDELKSVLQRHIKTSQPEPTAEHATRVSNRHRIVMVDDDPDLLQVYAETVRGWLPLAEIVAFDKPIEALKELEQRDPDLLVTGDRMPRLGGEQLVQRLLTRNISYPILVLTGNANAKQWVDDYIRRGINVRFCKKPGSDQEAEALRSLIGKLLLIPLASTEKPVAIAHPSDGARRPRIVVIWSEEGLLKAVELILRHSFNNAELLLYADSLQAWDELPQSTPDLLITYDRMPGITGEEIVRRLAGQGATFPILVLSGFGQVTRPWVEEFASRGLNIEYLDTPLDTRTFCRIVETSLNAPLQERERAKRQRDSIQSPIKSPATHPAARLLRIVVVDDEEWFVEMVATLVRRWFTEVNLLAFTNTVDALGELIASDPDLLMLGMVPLGVHILPLLAKRNVPYPILATSGYTSEEYVRCLAGPKLKLSFIRKPFSVDELHSHFHDHFGSAREFRGQVQKDTV